MSADTRGLSLQAQPSPQIITHLPVFTTQAMVNLSVYPTRDRSSHKWLLMFSKVTQGHRSLLNGFLLCGSVNLSSVLTLFFGPNLPGQTWTKEFKDLCFNLIATIHHGGCLFKDWGGGGGGE